MGLLACILNGKTTWLATDTFDCGLVVTDGHGGFTFDFAVALDAHVRQADDTSVDDDDRFTLRVLDRRLSFIACFFCDADRPTRVRCTATVMATLWTRTSSHANMSARGAKGPGDKITNSETTHTHNAKHAQQPSHKTNRVHQCLLSRPLTIQSACRLANSGMPLGSQ